MRVSLAWLLFFLVTMSVLRPDRCQATTYATWIMVWDGHDQGGWWKPGEYEGARVYVGGKWQSIDWADNNQINEYLDNIKKAGIRVVIADLTNGWGWLNTRCQYIQSLCALKGLKFCAAENSGGDLPEFESHARDIWDDFAGPASPHPETYFWYHGKPLIVCYAVRDWFNAYKKSAGPFRSRFNLVWSSGEDSAKDKWGWQLEPWVGSVPSTDSMFVTSSVKWRNSDDAWRKSLAWLDYNFALAKREDPAFVIVGSYDDIAERNAWLVADTTNCIPSRQTHDATGALSATAYYNRVKQWVAGRPTVVRGGYLRDGAYRILNRQDGRRLEILNTDTRPHEGTDGMVGARVIGAPRRDQRKDPMNGVFWLYHVGHNRYRIIALQSGLALNEKNGASRETVEQDEDSTAATERWSLERAGRGWYRLKNDGDGRLLTIATGSPVTGSPADLLVTPQNAAGDDMTQQWRFDRILSL